MKVFATDSELQNRVRRAREAASKRRIEQGAVVPVPAYLSRQAERAQEEMKRRQKVRRGHERYRKRLESSEIYNDDVLVRSREAHAALRSDLAELKSIDLEAAQAAVERAKDEFAEVEAEHATGLISDVEFAESKAAFHEAEQSARRLARDLKRLQRQVPIRKRQFFEAEEESAVRAIELLEPETQEIQDAAAQLLKAVEKAASKERLIEDSLPRGRFEKVTKRASLANIAPVLKKWLETGSGEVG